MPASGDPCGEEGSGVVQLMIVSIGLSLALRYTYQYFIGGGTYQLPGASPAPIQFGPISLSLHRPRSAWASASS